MAGNSSTVKTIIKHCNNNNLTLFFNRHEKLEDVVENDHIAPGDDIPLIHDVATNNARDDAIARPNISLDNAALQVAEIRVQLDADDGRESGREERSAEEKRTKTRSDVQKLKGGSGERDMLIEKE